MSQRAPKRPDPREEKWRAGLTLLTQHGLFRSFSDVSFVNSPRLAQSQGWAFVTTNGTVICHMHADLDPDEWAWVVAHALLHRGFGHLREGRRPKDAIEAAAACLSVNRFLRELRVGREPMMLPQELPTGDPEVLALRWRMEGVPPELRHGGTAGHAVDIVEERYPSRIDWEAEFAAAIARAAADAIEVASGARASMTDPVPRRTPWELARGWFLSSYPLLGGLAAHFTLVADGELAQSWDIAMAAVSPATGEIYLNPFAALSEAEWRFVIAHEMLHAALRHGNRVGGRDPYLWNVATDYVINGWLVEMGVGDLPDGVLYDPELAGLSAEAVYDRIATDLRRLRRLATLRGRGLGDVLGEPLSPTGVRPGVDLDEYYRRALATGLAYHESGQRGLLPAGLVEEIRALEHPPLPWDAQLARWFQEYVPAPEPRRSYARPSRRQSSTPDIPRPGRWRPEEESPRCTFGVVLDTSGSMDPKPFGLALGAIASPAGSGP